MNPTNFHVLLLGLVFKLFVLNAGGTILDLPLPFVEQANQLVDCPDLGLNIGDACDDGKDQTQNDRVQSNCKCQGIDRIDEDLDMDGFTKELDCDDTNPNINPNVYEIPDNGIDEDCSGSDLTQAMDPDFDEDGSTLGNGDCDDTDPTIYPGAPEIAGNGIDEDCNGIADDILSTLQENETANSFNVFPNPAADYLLINFKIPPSKTFQIQIADMLGKVIYQQSIDRLNESFVKINTQSYNTGFYVLSITQSGQRVSQKFMCLNQ